MIRITRRDNEPMEKMLRRFKKRCEHEGLVKDLKRHEYYEKPSERRRREAQILKKRIERMKKDSQKGIQEESE